MSELILGQRWYSILDGDPMGMALFERHYSSLKKRNEKGVRQFVGPGEKMVLMTTDGLALFVWRKFIDDSGQKGVNCAIFRNEGPHLSSSLIKEAVEIARNKWPRERLYTYVDADKIISPNPGYCFKMAGWRQIGKVKSGKIVLALFTGGNDEAE